MVGALLVRGRIKTCVGGAVLPRIASNPARHGEALYGGNVRLSASEASSDGRATPELVVAISPRLYDPREAATALPEGRPA